eukprot:3497698-Alexandrium_andersonii.AAC.1
MHVRTPSISRMSPRLKGGPHAAIFYYQHTHTLVSKAPVSKKHVYLGARGGGLWVASNGWWFEG